MVASIGRSQRVMVKLGVLLRGKATHACGRLNVAYSYRIRRKQHGARAPSFGLRQPLAFVAWGSTRFIVLHPASGMHT